MDETLNVSHDINDARQLLGALFNQDIPVVTTWNEEHAPRISDSTKHVERQCFVIPAFCPGKEEYADRNALISAAVIQQILGDQVPVSYTTHNPLNMNNPSQVGSLAGGWVLIDAQALSESEEARVDLGRHGISLLEHEAGAMSLDSAKQILGIACAARGELEGESIQHYYPPASLNEDVVAQKPTPTIRPDKKPVVSMMPDGYSAETKGRA